MSFTKFVLFGPIGKTRWPPCPLIGWDIFDFSSETAEQNSTKRDRKQDLNVLYQVCVFRADRKNKMAALASDWLRHFRLLLWNRWTEFNETWQEASLCFSGQSEKQDGRPVLWLVETFSTSPLKPLNRIQRNLTGSKISSSLTKFLFFGPIEKTRWPPWPLIGWDIFDFSSETAERNSTKLNRKQDLNVLYQVNVFQADRKNKMAALASDWLRHFWLFLWNRLTEFNELDRKQDLNVLYLPKFVFFGPISKQKCTPWPISQRGGTLYSGARYVALWASCYGSVFNKFLRKHVSVTSMNKTFYFFQHPLAIGRDIIKRLLVYVGWVCASSVRPSARLSVTLCLMQYYGHDTGNNFCKLTFKLLPVDFGSQRSKVKVKFGTMCVKPSWHNTDYSLCQITFKLHM